MQSDSYQIAEKEMRRWKIYSLDKTGDWSKHSTHSGLQYWCFSYELHLTAMRRLSSCHLQLIERKSSIPVNAFGINPKTSQLQSKCIKQADKKCSLAVS